MTIRAALDEATATLRAAGVETPRVDAEWLLADLLPGGRRDVVLGLDRALDRRPGRPLPRRRAPPGGARAAAADPRLAGFSRRPRRACRGRAGAAARDGDAGGVGAGTAPTRRSRPPAARRRRGHRVRLHRGGHRARPRRTSGCWRSSWTLQTAGVARFNVGRLGLGDRVTVVAADALTDRRRGRGGSDRVQPAVSADRPAAEPAAGGLRARARAGAGRRPRRPGGDPPADRGGAAAAAAGRRAGAGNRRRSTGAPRLDLDAHGRPDRRRHASRPDRRSNGSWRGRPPRFHIRRSADAGSFAHRGRRTTPG